MSSSDWKFFIDTFFWDTLYNLEIILNMVESLAPLT